MLHANMLSAGIPEIPSVTKCFEVEFKGSKLEGYFIFSVCLVW